MAQGLWRGWRPSVARRRGGGLLARAVLVLGLWLQASAWAATAPATQGGAPMAVAAQTPPTVALRVHLHGVETERREPLTSATLDALRRVEGWLQTRLSGPLDIDFVGSEAEFDAVMRAHDVKGWDERWLAGLALLDQRRIIVHVNGTRALTTRETIEHELVHFALHATSGSGWLPRWYQEGVATLMSGEATYERLREVTGAAALGQLDSLQALDHGFGGTQLSVERAYAVSAGFLIFAVRHGDNPTAVADLQRRLQQGVDFDAAFQMSFGAPPAALFTEYAGHMQAAASLWALLLSDSSVWSLVSALGMLAMLQAWRHRPRFDDEGAIDGQPADAIAATGDDGALDLEAVAAAAEAAIARPWQRRDFSREPLRVESATGPGVAEPGVTEPAADAATVPRPEESVNSRLSQPIWSDEPIADGRSADDRASAPPALDKIS